MYDRQMSEEAWLSCGTNLCVNLVMWESLLRPSQSRQLVLWCLAVVMCLHGCWAAWVEFMNVGQVFMESCFTTSFLLQRKWPLAQARSQKLHWSLSILGFKGPGRFLEALANNCLSAVSSIAFKPGRKMFLRKRRKPFLCSSHYCIPGRFPESFKTIATQQMETPSSAVCGLANFSI